MIHKETELNKIIAKKISNKILNGETSFVVNRRYYLIAQIGKVKYIYGRYDYGEGETDINDKLDVIGIVDENGKICVFDEYSFNLYYNEIWDDVGTFGRYYLPPLHDINNQAKQKLRDFYKKITVQVEDDFEITTSMVKDVRGRMLQQEYEKDCLKNCDIENIRKQDFANMLVGKFDLHKYVNDQISENKECLTKTKIYETKIASLLKRTDIVQEWEIRLANGIRNVDAKYINVEFLLNDKTGVGKMQPNIIMKHLISKERFSDYDFNTYVAGERLFEYLGARGLWGDKSTWLTPNNITKIKYGKKVLYQR